MGQQGGEMTKYRDIDTIKYFMESKPCVDRPTLTI